MGVWIEIFIVRAISAILIVAPFVGVWIEINIIITESVIKVSLPSWECGLKYDGKWILQRI